LWHSLNGLFKRQAVFLESNRSKNSCVNNSCAGARAAVGDDQPAAVSALTKIFRAEVKQRGILDADSRAWEHSGFFIDARKRIAIVDRDVPSLGRACTSGWATKASTNTSPAVPPASGRFFPADETHPTMPSRMPPIRSRRMPTPI